MSTMGLKIGGAGIQREQTAWSRRKIIILAIFGIAIIFLVLVAIQTIIIPYTCILQGGVWGKFSLYEEGLCNFPTSDGGIPCTDSNQCEGACLYDYWTYRENLQQMINQTGFFPISMNATGFCSGFKKLYGGCWCLVENGTIDHTECLCRD